MEAIVIPGKEINCENGIVDIFLGNLFLERSNAYWIEYLVQENKLDAFKHPRLYFEFNWTKEEELPFFQHCKNMSDFSIIDITNFTYMHASLLDWISNIDSFTPKVAEEIIYNIWFFYPNVAKAFNLPKEKIFRYGSNTIHMSEEYVLQRAIKEPKFFKIAHATVLLLEAPEKKYVTMPLEHWAEWLKISWALAFTQNERHCAFQLARSLTRAFPEWGKVYDMDSILKSLEGHEKPS